MTITYQSAKICDKTCNDVQWSTQDKRNKRSQCSSQIPILVLGLLTLLLVFCAVGIVVILIKQKQPPVIEFKQETANETVGAKEITSLDIKKRPEIISRQEWAARSPVAEVNLKLPVPYVVICHTAMKNCKDQISCTDEVRLIQGFHMEIRHWDDIAYNFLIGGDGRVYEGTGWKFEGAHTYGYNAKGMGIAFMGNYNHYSPTKQQVSAAQQLIEMGVELNYLADYYKLVAAMQLQHTQSPGLMLYESMKSWPHWTESP